MTLTWQFITFFAILSAFWILYRVFTDEPASQKDRSEASFNLLDDLDDLY